MRAPLTRRALIHRAAVGGITVLGSGALAGVLRAAWTDVPSMAVESPTGWSLLEGRSETRKLRLDRVDAPPIRYDEAFLGVPAEVALALAEAYRKRTLGR